MPGNSEIMHCKILYQIELNLVFSSPSAALHTPDKHCNYQQTAISWRVLIKLQKRFARVVSTLILWEVFCLWSTSHDPAGFFSTCLVDILFCWFVAAYEHNADKMKSHQPYPQGQPQFYQPTGPQVMMVAPAPLVQGPVKDHLIWSVFNLVLLCPVLGLIAVIFWALSRNNKKSGMYRMCWRFHSFHNPCFLANHNLVNSLHVK